ncbi:MAG: cell envelope integrity protein CreD [Steroidobacteraceae bacterium]
MNIVGSSGSVTIKALIVGVIILVLLIPLSLLRSLVNERAVMRAAAHSKVAEGWGGHVRVPGPILIVPTRQEVVRDGKAAIIHAHAYFLPNELTFTTELRMQSEPRRVGIYEVPVYLADVEVNGHLNADRLSRWQQQHPERRLQWQLARVLLPLAQTRELRDVKAIFAGQSLRFVPANSSDMRGIEAPLAWTQAPGSAMSFDIRLLLAGSGGFSLLPLGSQTHARLSANWPHPSFSGAFAPTRYSIGQQRFAAEWNVLELNRTYGSAWLEGEVQFDSLVSSATGVDIFQSVDIYQRGERALKYALVFIALTFLTFFAWEQVSDVRLHPLQYLLLGLALSVFYLLLVALTEHVSFALAYNMAATALVILIASYIAGALRSTRRGLAVSVVVAVTYAFLYALVLSEDYALLLGASAVFAALAAVMTITRRIDWYRSAQ